MGEAATGHIDGGKQPPGARNVIVEFGTEKFGAKLEQPLTPSTDSVWVWSHVHQGSPTVFQLCEIASFHTARKELFRRGLQTWFGRDLTLVELTEPLAPPSQLDRSQRGLRRSRDDIRHRLVDIQQRIERGAKVGWPVEPDEVSVAQITDR